jgi:hypothetical protein
MSAQVMSQDTTGPGVRPAMSERRRFAAILDQERVAIKGDGRVSQAKMLTPKKGSA